MIPTMNQAHHRAIIHPSLDPWLVGGLSIIVLVVFLLLSSTIPQELILGDFLTLTVLLNGTHFMASYALLYSSREHIRRYRAASIYLPIGLLAVGTLGIWLVGAPYENPLIIQGIIVVTALYLALHYTGQAWGMMASYAFLHGIRFSQSERTILRACLRTMAAWQMGWALTTSQHYIPSAVLPWASQIMQLLNIAAITSLLVGILTLAWMRRRLGGPMPTSILLPFGSLYVWYAFLSVFPQSIFWVQIFHAIQYLSFPARIDMNRAVSRGAVTNSTEQWRHLLSYSAALTMASFLVFVGINKGLNYPSGGFETHWLVLVCLINIHHYFIDGCIWHISNPEVRADLFSHLRPPGC